MCLSLVWSNYGRHYKPRTVSPVFKVNHLIVDPKTSLPPSKSSNCWSCSLKVLIRPKLGSVNKPPPPPDVPGYQEIQLEIEVFTLGFAWLGHWAPQPHEFRDFIKAASSPTNFVSSLFVEIFGLTAEAMYIFSRGNVPGFSKNSSHKATPHLLLN